MLERSSEAVNGAVMPPAKFLVTGLHGMMGAHLQSSYGKQCDLVAMDISGGVDVTDPAQVEAVFKKHPDAVALIHLAAYTDVSGASRQEGDESGSCYRLNVTGTENVAVSAQRHGVHLVHVSTDFVFDGEKQEAYSEEDAPNPIEWYGRTKFLAEEVVRNSGVSATIVRTAFPYFCKDVAKKDIVSRIRASLAMGESLKLFDDQIITPTFGQDIISALYLMATKRPAGEIFHVTGSSSLSPYRLGVEVAEAFGLNAGNLEASSMVDFLEVDPRPRQRCLRIANGKYGEFAEAQGRARPLTVKEGLRRLRDAKEE